MLRPLEEAHLQQVEQELLEEKAHALGRIGRRLLELSQKLNELWRRWTAGDPTVLEAYVRIRQEFWTYLWYWHVQREAAGFRVHPSPETWLFIPPPLTSDDESKRRVANHKLEAASSPDSPPAVRHALFVPGDYSGVGP
ncbi:MAG: hypothetical protein NZ742_05690 [Acidobacteria bacterium]|nr:hypothetical protein [Acidobacteriota bacterium]MDW7984355.1 hypothetical protein [Acidobacteriota bacterium]